MKKRSYSENDRELNVPIEDLRIASFQDRSNSSENIIWRRLCIQQPLDDKAAEERYIFANPETKEFLKIVNPRSEEEVIELMNSMGIKENGRCVDFLPSFSFGRVTLLNGYERWRSRNTY